MNKSVVIFFIIAFNLVPVLGVFYYDWQPFEAFWFFWVETLIIAVFNSIRILYSQCRLQDEVNIPLPLTYNINKAFKYLLIRIAIFLFYSVFIIVFIGFIASNDAAVGNVLSTLLFQNSFFNLSLLISFASQLYYLIFYFFRSSAFISSRPESYAAVFDSRQLIIHIAVVLGALGGIFLAENTAYGKYSSTFIISLLCICKCIAELFNYKSAAVVQGK